MSKVPVSIIVMSILSLLYALLGGCSAIFNAVVIFVPFNWGPATTVMDLYKNDPLIFSLTLVASAFSLIVSVLLTIGAINSLRCKASGRRLMIFCAWANIAANLIFFPSQIVVVRPKINALFAPGSPELAGQNMGYMFSAVAFLLTLVYWALVLYFYNRPLRTRRLPGQIPRAPNQFPGAISVAPVRPPVRSMMVAALPNEVATDDTDAHG